MYTGVCRRAVRRQIDLDTFPQCCYVPSILSIFHKKCCREGYVDCRKFNPDTGIIIILIIIVIVSN